MSTSVKFNRKYTRGTLYNAYTLRATSIGGEALVDGALYFASDGGALFVAAKVGSVVNLKYVANLVENAVNFKGVVPTESALPSADSCNIGDMYIASDTGIEYICVYSDPEDEETDHRWEKIGSEHVDKGLYMGDTTFTNGRIVVSSGNTGSTTSVGISNGTVSGSEVDFVTGISINGGNLVAAKSTVRSASSLQSGLMSSNDFLKLQGIEEGAEKNIINAIQANGDDIEPSEDGTVNIPVVSSTNSGVMSSSQLAKLQEVDNKLTKPSSGAAAGKLLAMSDGTNGTKVISLSNAAISSSAEPLGIVTGIHQDANGNIVADYMTFEGEGGEMFVTDKLKLAQDALDDEDWSTGDQAITFVSSLSQNAQGVITAIKSDVRPATISQSGLMTQQQVSVLNAAAAAFTWEE